MRPAAAYLLIASADMSKGQALGRVSPGQESGFAASGSSASSGPKVSLLMAAADTSKGQALGGVSPGHESGFATGGSNASGGTKRSSVSTRNAIASAAPMREITITATPGGDTAKKSRVGGNARTRM